MKVYLIKSISYRLLNMKIKELCEGYDNITTFSLLDTSIFDCIDDDSYYDVKSFVTRFVTCFL